MALSARLSPAPVPYIPLTAEQQAARDRVLEKITSGAYPLEDVACFCGEVDHVVIGERDRYSLPVTTVLCSRCGLMRTSPRFTPEANERFYQEEYRNLYRIEEGRDRLFTTQVDRGRDYLRLLQAIAPDSATVYEVGCGAGGLLFPFREAGISVCGCDYGSDYLEVGRARGLDLVHGSVDDLLAHTQAQADALLLIHVAEHFLDLEQELAAMARAVKPGGLLLIEVPGLRDLGRAYRNDLLCYLQNAHTYHFTGVTLRYVLETVGFEVALVDEHVIAIARVPIAGTLVRRQVAPVETEAFATLRYLAALEKRIIERSNG